MKYVKAKEEELQERSEKEAEDAIRANSVLEYFLLESGMDKKDIVGVVCDILLAGVDTVSAGGGGNISFTDPSLKV